RPLHHLRYLHVLDLHHGDVHTPRDRLVCDGLLEVLVEVGAVGQERVQIRAPDYGTKSGLGELGGGDRVVLDRHHRAHRVGHLEHHHGVHAGGDVVAGDDLLRRDGQRDHAPIHPHRTVQERQHQHQTRAQWTTQPAEAEDDQPLVLPHHLQRDHEEHEHQGGHHDHEEHLTRHS